ncbi:MAG: cation diffusion facilitator family transporter [Bacteroidia bacterium]
MNTNGQKAEKAIYFSIFGNILISASKWIAGYTGNSYALIADAIESTTDIFSSLMVLVGLKYSNRPADKNHPYGHGRIEPLITFLVVAFLVASALFIAHDAVENIRKPHALPKPFTLIVLAAIIIWKEISFRVMIRKSKATGSSSLKADAWHHRSDAITSVAAFIGISVALIMGKGYEAADDWAALFASLFIIYNSYLIIRPAFAEIMDEHVHDELKLQIKEKAKHIQGVIDTEKCFIRKTGMKYYVDLHITVAAAITVKEGHDIAHRAKDHLMHELPEIADILIHIEPDSE